MVHVCILAVTRTNSKYFMNFLEKNTNLDFSEFTIYLEKAVRVLVAIPANATEDEALAGLALCEWLENNGKFARILFTDNYPVDARQFGVDDFQIADLSVSTQLVLTLSGLPASSKVHLPATVQEMNSDTQVVLGFSGAKVENLSVQGTFLTNNFDLVILLGSARWEDLSQAVKQNLSYLSGLPKVNVSNRFIHRGIANIQLGLLTAVCVSEVVAVYMRKLSDQYTISPNTATLLYAGLTTATRNLLSEQVTSEGFALAGWLLEQGAQQEQASLHLAPKLPLSVLKLFGEVLEHLQVLAEVPLGLAVTLNAVDTTRRDLVETIINVQNWLGGDYPVILGVPNIKGGVNVCGTLNFGKSAPELETALNLQNAESFKQKHLECVFGVASDRDTLLSDIDKLFYK